MDDISSKKSLARALSMLSGFENPKVMLEQYMTDPDVASSLLWTAGMRGDIKDRKIADFGAGTGILGIGALLLGAAEVIFVESENSALEICKKNVQWAQSHFEIEGTVRFIESDIDGFTEEVEVIVENPPFGTKIEHADRRFLTQAMQCSKTIYSLHKSTSKPFIEALCRDNGYNMFVLEDYHYPLTATMKHHTKKREIIDVTLFLLKR